MIIRRLPLWSCSQWSVVPLSFHLPLYEWRIKREQVVASFTPLVDRIFLVTVEVLICCRDQLVRSNSSKNCRGDRILMPRNSFNTSKSSSPVTITSALPASAVARTTSSSLSRQIRSKSRYGSTNSQRSTYAAKATRVAGPILCRRSRIDSNSCRSVSDQISSHAPAASSTSSSQKPWPQMLRRGRSCQKRLSRDDFEYI